MTREHAIPKWVATDPYFAEVLKAYQPAARAQPRVEPIAHDAVAITVQVTGTPRPDRIEVRVVCNGCNNGWMSDLEKDVAPFVRPLMRGESRHVPGGAIALLKRWAMKTAFMFEFSDHSTRTVTRSQLEACLRGAEEVDGVRVLIARYAGDLRIRAVHSKFGVVQRADIRQSLGHGGVTVLVLGEVAFIVVSMTDEAMLPHIIMSYPKELAGQHELITGAADSELWTTIDHDYVERITGVPTA